MEEIRVEPPYLVFSPTGGYQSVQVHNKSKTNRYAIKLKCSDNEIYRFNPVFSIVEPGITVTLNAYRNNTVFEDSVASKPDKLVLLVAKVYIYRFTA